MNFDIELEAALVRVEQAQSEIAEGYGDLAISLLGRVLDGLRLMGTQYAALTAKVEGLEKAIREHLYCNVLEGGYDGAGETKPLLARPCRTCSSRILCQALSKLRGES